MDRGLLALLSRSGPLASGRLREQLGWTSATLHRRLTEVADRLLTVGRARATTYAARRDVPGVPVPVPVFQVGADGLPRPLCTVHPVAPFGVWVAPDREGGPVGFAATSLSDPGPDPQVDLPWFLLDARPSGFLGRAWQRGHADQGFPADLQRWTGDDVLRFLVQHGVDLPGDLVLGVHARDRVRDGDFAREVVPVDALDARLPELAEAALAGEVVGSSAGGEQPKLDVWIVADGARTQHLVKFSPPTETAVGRRWADLLVVEHLTHEVLRTHGVPACHSTLRDAGGRRFLLTERFDRLGAAGRRGVVSLRALDDAGVGAQLRSWSVITRPLVASGRVAADVHARVVWLEALGHLLANTDMHPGNLSLWCDGATLGEVAPVYDMLPMAFAPRSSGELVPTVYDPAVHRDRWPDGVTDVAREVWDAVIADVRVSEDFRQIARVQRAFVPR